MRRPTGSTLCLPAPSPPSSASAATTARPSSFPPTSCPKWKNSATPSASSNPASSSPKALSHSSAINTPNTNSRKSSSRSSLLTTSPRRPTDMELRSGFQVDVAQQKSDTVKIFNYQGEMKSEFASDKIETYMKEYRDKVVKERLAAKHLAETVLKPFEVNRENVAPPEKVSGAAFGGIIGYMVILLCMTGAMYPSMHLTAGEKERGTVDTILSSPISRMHHVLGKF